MTDDPAATSWTRGETAAFAVPSGYRSDDGRLVDEGDPLVGAAPSEDPDPILHEEYRRAPLLGALSLAAAILAVIMQIIAIVTASSGAYLLGTTLAVAAIGLSAIALLLGIIAMIAGRGRWIGLVGAVVGVVTNPLVLVAVLRFFGGA